MGYLRTAATGAGEFVSQPAEINALAERSPGFVWRLQTEDGDATAVRPYAGDDSILINLSVWTDLHSLREYVFRGAHAVVMRRRREWFECFESVRRPLVGSRRAPAVGRGGRGPPRPSDGQRLDTPRLQLRAAL